MKGHTLKSIYIYTYHCNLCMSMYSAENNYKVWPNRYQRASKHNRTEQTNNKKEIVIGIKFHFAH